MELPQITDRMPAWVARWIWPWILRAAVMAVGAFFAFGQVPTSWLITLIVLPVLAWAFLQCKTAWRALGLGWWFSFGYFLHALEWITLPFQVGYETYNWYAVPGILSAAGACAFCWMWGFWGAKFAANRLALSNTMALLVWICLWVVMDWVRSFILTGMAWATLSYIWIDSPFVQWAAFFGPHGLSLLTLALFCLPLGAVVARRDGWWRAPTLSALVFALLWLGATMRIPDGPAPIHPDELIVRVVQPNVPQHLKWDPAYVYEFYNRTLEISSADTQVIRPSGGSNRVDVVVWSEVAFQFTLGIPDPEFAAKTEVRVEQLREAISPAYFLGGVAHYDEDKGQGHNSMLLANPDFTERQFYHKHHLVVFGEYTPFRPLMEWLGIVAIAEYISDMGTGPGPRILRMAGLPAVLPLICFEAVFAYDTRVAGDRAEWMAHATNDAWFGLRSGPYQHFAQTQIRAVENGLAVARAANTGVSGIIDPYGRVISDVIGMKTSGSADALLPAPLPPTLYSRTGEALWLGLVVLILGAVGVVARRRNDER